MRIYEASPGLTPGWELSDLEKNIQTSSAPHSYTYDEETGENIFIDGSEFDHPAEPMPDSPPSIIPFAFPNDWLTPDPQNYADTRSTCKLLIYTPNGEFHGTGWLVSNNTVITAGHNIFNLQHGGDFWCNYIVVMPSYSSSHLGGYYGAVTITPSSMEVGSDWLNFFSWTDDWGILHLPESFSCGYYTPLVAGDNINAWWVRAEGYDRNYTDLRNTGGNIISANGREMITAAQAYVGMSGGPVREGRGYIIGIIEGYVLESPNDTSGNAAVIKIDDSLYNKIMSNR